MGCWASFSKCMGSMWSCFKPVATAVIEIGEDVAEEAIKAELTKYSGVSGGAKELIVASALKLLSGGAQVTEEAFNAWVSKHVDISKNLVKLHNATSTIPFESYKAGMHTDADSSVQYSVPAVGHLEEIAVHGA